MPTINVYALFRNSSKHIQRTLSQLSDFTLLSEYNFNFFLFENDSTDNTAETLQNWCALYGGQLLSKNFGAPSFASVDSQIRTALMAQYRNQNKRIGENVLSDLSLIVDSDLQFNNDDLLALINALKQNPDAVAAIGSCEQNIPDLTFPESGKQTSTYDLYCFIDRHGNRGMYFSSTPFVNQEDTEKFISGIPVEVTSGFGGMMLVHSEAYNACKYSGERSSEHVSLCYELRNYGKILAVPNCRPFSTVDLSKINLDACKEIGKQQRQQYTLANQLRVLSVADEYKFKFNKE